MLDIRHRKLFNYFHSKCFLKFNLYTGSIDFKILMTHLIASCFRTDQLILEYV